MNEAYQDFVTKFLSIFLLLLLLSIFLFLKFLIDFVAPIGTLRVNLTLNLVLILTPSVLFEPVTSTIKKSSNQTGKVSKAILSVQNFCLKRIINNTKEILFEEKIAENKNNPKEVLETLKSLGMPSKGKGAI